MYEMWVFSYVENGVKVKDVFDDYECSWVVFIKNDIDGKV